jgi:hypothetical protein
MTSTYLAGPATPGAGPASQDAAPAGRVRAALALARPAGSVSAASPAGSARAGQRVTVSGTITGARAILAGSGTAYECVLSDGLGCGLTSGLAWPNR